MRGVGKEAILIAAKRREFIEQAYILFCEKNIESVSLQDIANRTDYGIATLYRYFTNKPTLVVETAICKWEEYLGVNMENRPTKDFSGMTAAQIFEFYLESFINLYRNNRDLLRFNQFFNVYIQAENIDPAVMKPYLDFIVRIKDNFNIVFQRSKTDHTMVSDGN